MRRRSRRRPGSRSLSRARGTGAATVHTLALGTGAQGPQAQAEITGLTPGGYDASWLLTDVHGDSATVTDTFGVHPGAAIFSTGSSSVLGAGPVPNWLTALAQCLVRRVGKRPRGRAGSRPRSRRGATGRSRSGWCGPRRSSQPAGPVWSTAQPGFTCVCCARSPRGATGSSSASSSASSVAGGR